MIENVTFTIDGQTITVPKGTTVYTATKRLGIEIPIFCYQDRMPPFGACRVCLVEVEKMQKPQTSCTLAATEGMVVRTQADAAVRGRKEILEFLLINHPLDCPICDRGGECPLQDQTIRFGPGMSRFFEEKRHFKKPIPLGSVLMLDRERCITCARCTRFGDVVAGDHALEFIDRGYKTEVGTPDGKPVQSKFIGNTIMICPVGALTSQVYRFRARPWDNESTNSTCTLCPVGCSMILDARDGEIMRTRSQENPEVNDIWLCDKGWFGYEFSSSPDRLQQPLIRRKGTLQPTSWEEALSFIALKMQEAKPKGRLAALGGNALTVEENYLFQQLMRQGAGVNHVDHRIGLPLDDAISPGMHMSIGDIEKCSFVVIYGLDMTEEFPVIWLRLKQAINKGTHVLFFGHFAPETARYFSKTVLHRPGNEIEVLKTHFSEIAALAEQGRGAIFVGRQYLATEERQNVIAVLSAFTKVLPNVTLNIMEARGNSMGARFAGMHPHFGPLGKAVESPGLNATEILNTAARDGWDFLYVAGADLTQAFPKALLNEMRSRLGCLVVQDLFLTKTAMMADVVLPTWSFVEKGGSFINIEGRIQKLRPGKKIPTGLYSDAAIFVKIAQKLGLALVIDLPFLERLHGKIALRDPFVQPKPIKKKNEESAFTATFAPALFDNGIRMQHNEHLIQLAKEPRIRLHSKSGFTDDDRVEIRYQNRSIRGKIALDRTVAENTVIIPLGFDTIPTQELGADLLNGLPVEIEKT